MQHRSPTAFRVVVGVALSVVVLAAFPARGAADHPDGLDAVVLLALDPDLGKAAIRIGDDLELVAEGQELPLRPRQVTSAGDRYVVAEVLADRLVLEPVRDGETGDSPERRRRQVWIFKPRRPGLASRIRVVEGDRPRPFVPDRDLPDEPPNKKGVEAHSPNGGTGGGRP